MDPNDRRAIDDLFSNLDETARRAGPPEPEADDLIHRRLRENPAAAYHLAQTVVAQRAALENAQDRIDQLEGWPGYSRGQAQAQAAQPREEGGLLSRIFGGGSGGSRTAVPTTHAPDPRGAHDPRFNRGMGRPGGGGFLAGAAQTAMGVAGGVIVGNMLMNAFGGDQAQAQTAVDSGGQDAQPQDAGGDYGGDDFGDVGDFGGDW